MSNKPRFPGRISDWIIHKDNQLIAFNKPAGLAVQPDKTGSINLLGMGAAYVHHDLYLIHRLDRPVSGCVIMGQKSSAQTELTKQLQAGTVEKTYLAIVGEAPPETTGTLVHHLKNGPNNRSLVAGANDEGAKRAELSYQLLGSSDRYHLLEIKLVTGRKHQIRAQLAAAGFPVRGDRKYGFKRNNPDGHIDLHSLSFSYDHPVTSARTTHYAPPPTTPVWEAFAEYIPANENPHK